MTTERPRTVLAGRYALEEELRRSAVGITFRASDEVLHRPVVVRLIHPRLADDPAFAARFAEEARALAAVSSPRLARLLDTGNEQGLSFVVREYLDGDPLGWRLARTQPLDLGSAVGIARDLLEALDAAHAAGVLHLHLVPGDVMVGPDGRARLADLGVAEPILAARERDDAVAMLGAANLAPEIVHGDPLDLTADIWGTGTLLRAMLPSDVPRSLRLVLDRATARDPDQRFPSALAFARAIDELELVPARNPAAGASEESHGSGRGTMSFFGTWIAIPLLVLVAAGLVVLAGLWLGRLEIGGPVGIRLRPDDEPTVTAVGSLPVVSVSAYDPYGDGAEHDSEVPFVLDGDPATTWTTEGYADLDLNKDGVGLLFDLGSERSVRGFRLRTPLPGFPFSVGVGDDLKDLIPGPGATAYLAEGAMRRTFPPASGRYVLLWITSVVPTADGARAQLAEFEVLGT